MAKQKQLERDLQFIGAQKNDCIVIANYGNASITAVGNFDLGGLIFCPKSKVEFNLAGNGIIRFTGTCKELVLQNIDGDCAIDLSNLTCKMVRCEMIKGNSKITFGEIRSIYINSVDA